MVSWWVIPLLFLIHNHSARLGWEPLMLWWQRLELHHPCRHHTSRGKHRALEEWRDTAARLMSVTFVILQHSSEITHLFLIPSPLLPNWCWVLSDTTSAPSCIFSQQFSVYQLSCSAFWEQNKAARLCLWAGWTFPNQPLRNLLHPEPQANKGSRALQTLFLHCSGCHLFPLWGALISEFAQKVSYKAEYARADNLAWCSYITV